MEAEGGLKTNEKSESRGKSQAQGAGDGRKRDIDMEETIRADERGREEK